MPPEGPKQVRETIVVNLMHQCQQPANLALGKAFARKPCQVITREVGQKNAFVFPKRHGHRDERL